MKIKFSRIIIILLLTITAVSLSLWQYEKRNQDDVKNLCQASAISALAQFEECKTLGDESSFGALSLNLESLSRRTIPWSRTQTMLITILSAMKSTNF